MKAEFWPISTLHVTRRQSKLQSLPYFCNLLVDNTLQTDFAMDRQLTLFDVASF